MAFYFPFGQELHPLTQGDRTRKKVFVLGVYASAVHATWKRNGQLVCRALAVASEPRIFWDGDPTEAERIISSIEIPPELGTLEPAGRNLNGPSAKMLDEHILASLGLSREDAWLCDCLPETRLNPGQANAIRRSYDPLKEAYGLNDVTVPRVPKSFCDEKRAEEITEELMESGAELLVLLGDIPIRQYLKRVADVPYSTLKEYCDLYGYGTRMKAVIRRRKDDGNIGRTERRDVEKDGGQNSDGNDYQVDFKTIEVLPFTHPHQIGGMGAHSGKWKQMHLEWEERQRTGKGPASGHFF